MDEELELAIATAEEEMQNAIKHFEAELTKIRAGKANPFMLDGIQVPYYGTMAPLKNVSGINTPDPKTLVIQPFEKSLLKDIEKAILDANLGFTPSNDGSVIRINIPPLTEERRKGLVKQAKGEAEHCKVSIRTARKDANEYIKGLVKQGLPEDMGKGAEEKIQNLTNAYTAKTDAHLESKEKEIMTV
ncbi:MAG: Ribosome-recycling factor [Bacteroidia bacterium]|nr:Ribosome-recycling factor [Bacteroidia bacterium]